MNPTRYLVAALLAAVAAGPSCAPVAAQDPPPPPPGTDNAPGDVRAWFMLRASEGDFVVPAGMRLGISSIGLAHPSPQGSGTVVQLNITDPASPHLGDALRWRAKVLPGAGARLPYVGTPGASVAPGLYAGPGSVVRIGPGHSVFLDGYDAELWGYLVGEE